MLVRDEGGRRGLSRRARSESIREYRCHTLNDHRRPRRGLSRLSWQRWGLLLVSSVSSSPGTKAIFGFRAISKSLPHADSSNCKIRSTSTLRSCDRLPDFTLLPISSSGTNSRHSFVNNRWRNLGIPSSNGCRVCRRIEDRRWKPRFMDKGCPASIFGRSWRNPKIRPTISPFSMLSRLRPMNCCWDTTLPRIPRAERR